MEDLFRLLAQNHQNGNLPEAESLCRRILQADPANANSHYNLGFILYSQGRLDEASACYRQALDISPYLGQALNGLGMVLADQGNIPEAIACYRQALDINPNHATALNNLGNALHKLRRPEEAVACYRQAIRLMPNRADTHNNLGLVLASQGQLDQAIACYRESLRINPQYADACINMGDVLFRQARSDQAIFWFREALRINPNHAHAYHNLGFVFHEGGQLREAIVCNEQALRINPTYAEAHFERALVWLLQGDYERGWREYEWRWRAKQMSACARSFEQPRWGGSPLPRKTILLYAEQGLGDTIQFIRYAPLVKELAGKVVLECPRELVSLLKSCTGLDEIITQGSRLPPFDVQAPLLSLPDILKTTMGTIPASIPYLSADPQLSEHWKMQMASFIRARSEREMINRRIGIVWQGNPRILQPECRTADQRRSIPLSFFAPLARIPGVRLFSLQKGYGTEQLAEVKSQWNVIDLGDRLEDFMDTAAVMMNLDLIISADTAPAHSAGALGRPVWTVLPFAGCWRWLLDREDSPWYPTMRLFRQKTPGDWEEVFERIARELTKQVESRNGPSEADQQN